MSDSMPKDPVMLLSFVNTQLRDHYASFCDFCRSYMVDEKQIESKLNSIDYEYDASVNQFI